MNLVEPYNDFMKEVQEELKRLGREEITVTAEINSYPVEVADIDIDVSEEVELALVFYAVVMVGAREMGARFFMGLNRLDRGEASPDEVVSHFVEAFGKLAADD